MIENKKLVSLIIPCYNEEETIKILYHEICQISKQLKRYNFEYLFIDDGSKDGSLSLIKNLSEMDNRVLFYSFSRNFGKEAAMYAGFCNAHGDYIAVMDADMQDPPFLLSQMIQILEKEPFYDSVATRRKDREGEPWLRSLFARLFYKIINHISDVDIVDGARDFRLMKREMVDVIIHMGEYNRFSKGIFGWIGFHTYWLSYKNVERAAGNSKWSFWKLFKYSIDGIINFSHVPLALASWSGITFTLFSFLTILFIVFRKLFFGDPVAGWASLVCTITFIGGIQLFCMGIMGHYLAKMYLEEKKRPHYIISETNVNNVIKVK